jgi:tetratricopeptide (TPR) repeat protein
MGLIADFAVRAARSVTLLLLVLPAFPVTLPSAHAQATGPMRDLGSQYEAAFQEMLQKPGDLEVLFRFASAAAQAGDYEGAISALERMLLINPDLPRVRLELGVLYYRLKSYETSRIYLEGALASSAIPADVRTRAEEYLAEIRKQLSPSRFSSDVFLGTRYQSDANLGPATSAVRLFGQAANLNQQAFGRADWGEVGQLRVRHFYDLGLQDRAVMETQFTAYGNRQFQVSQANVSLLDLTTGPRFQIFNGIFEDVSLRPLVTGGYIWINDTPFYGSYGAGLETGVLLTNRIRNDSVFTWRRQEHPDTWYLPTNSQLTGVELNASTAFQYQVNDLVTIFALGNFQRFETAQTPWQNYTLWGAGGGLSFRFPDPALKTGLFWSISLNVVEQWWAYDSPDPIVDPGTLHQQSDTIANLILTIPFDERTTLSLSGGRFNREATVQNYAFTNNSFMIGITWRF